MKQNVLSSGHKWSGDGERCELCGDKDWRADKFCSANPDVAALYAQDVSERRDESKNQRAVTCDKDARQEPHE